VKTPSWFELEKRAATAQVRILRRKMSVGIYTTTVIVSHIIDLYIGDLDEPDADALLRAMVAVALGRLEAMIEPARSRAANGAFDRRGPG
jgi:hypothetical protein